MTTRYLIPIFIGVATVSLLFTLASGLYLSKPYNKYGDSEPKPQLIINTYELYLFSKELPKSEQCQNGISYSVYRGFPAAYINNIGVSDCKSITTISTGGLIFNLFFYAILAGFVIYVIEHSQRY